MWKKSEAAKQPFFYWTEYIRMSILEYKYMSILECIELNWWRKYMKKVRSSQAVILLLNWAKTQFFPVSIIKCSFIEKKVKQKERYISNCVFGGIYLDSLQHICSSLLLLDLHFSNQTRFDLKSISGIPIVIAQ